mmetsp:Transcript_14955/g.35295  ORF Transcript_14955/g.35295 Transcript_14955/m.35295 type:complete len:235 (+) Transcript_14955:1592-2296(+)
MLLHLRRGRVGQLLGLLDLTESLSREISHGAGSTENSSPSLSTRTLGLGIGDLLAGIQDLLGIGISRRDQLGYLGRSGGREHISLVHGTGVGVGAAATSLELGVQSVESVLLRVEGRIAALQLLVSGVELRGSSIETAVGAKGLNLQKLSAGLGRNAPSLGNELPKGLLGLLGLSLGDLERVGHDLTVSESCGLGLPFLGLLQEGSDLLVRRIHRSHVGGAVEKRVSLLASGVH